MPRAHTPHSRAPRRSRPCLAAPSGSRALGPRAAALFDRMLSGLLACAPPRTRAVRIPHMRVVCIPHMCSVCTPHIVSTHRTCVVFCAHADSRRTHLLSALAAARARTYALTARSGAVRPRCPRNKTRRAPRHRAVSRRRQLISRLGCWRTTHTRSRVKAGTACGQRTGFTSVSVRVVADRTETSSPWEEHARGIRQRLLSRTSWWKICDSVE
eukprot:3934269-Rhodomonas_salina.6